MFHVTQKIQNKKEEQLAVFVHHRDAKTFVQAKIEWDEKINSPTTQYLIYERKQLLETQIWDPSHSSQTQSKSFHPTPAPTTLRPPGSPPPLVDDDED